MREPVWIRETGPPPKPRLSRERIVEAAIGLLDVEGVPGFSMRRLAARLSAGTMTLYTYVATREDVLDLALDAVMQEIELSGREDVPWRAAVVEQLTQTRMMMRRHPWVAALIGTRPLLGPASLARSEHLYATLARAGLGGPRLAAAVNVLFDYVYGFVASENALRSQVTDDAEEADMRRRAHEHLVRLRDRYPMLARHARLEDADADSGFALGLEIILDGIQAQLAR